MTKVEKAAKIIISQCMGIVEQDAVLIITDEPSNDLARIIWSTALSCKVKALLIEIPMLPLRKYDEYKVLADIIKSVAAVIVISIEPLFFSDLFKQIKRTGIRIMSMSCMSHTTFARIYDTDFKSVVDISCKLADIFSIGHLATITSVNGTHLEVPIAGQKGYAITGILNENHRFSELPAGVACVVPRARGMNGILVVDSGMTLRSDDKEKIHITIKDGRASRISGGTAVANLRKLLSRYNSDARLVAELGVGTNKAAKLYWDAVEDSKVYGALHIALGNNTHLGGSNTIPFKTIGIIHKANLDIDGRRIVHNGKLLIDEPSPSRKCYDSNK